MNQTFGVTGICQAASDRYLTPAEAADLLGVKPRQLEDWRFRGRGPRYRKFSRLVRYSMADLKAFADAGIVEPYDSSQEAMSA